MSTFFGDSIYEHPVVKRLRQQVQDLEKENAELKNELPKLLGEVNRLENWYYSSLSSQRNWIERATKAEAEWLKNERLVKELEQQMEKFNHLSPIQKMFYHFDISSWFIK